MHHYGVNCVINTMREIEVLGLPGAHLQKNANADFDPGHHTFVLGVARRNERVVTPESVKLRLSQLN